MRNMNKKIIALVICLLLVVCGVVGFTILRNQNQDNNTAAANVNSEKTNLDEKQTQNNSNNQAIIDNTPQKEDEEQNNISNNKKIAVIYFSATGTTEKAAKTLNTVVKGDLIEIEPKVPYTSADLNYNSDCRANDEQNDKNSRPEIGNSIETDEYDVIFLGYPIWWGTMPRIIQTFIETHNLGGKIVIPFCTSGSSGISTSEGDLKDTDSSINWLQGRRLTSNISENELSKWIDSLNY